MASKRKKKRFDLYWITLFILVIGVLGGALFVGKYLGDKFVNDGELLKVDDTSIKTLSKPTIVPHNNSTAYEDSNNQVIVPPSFQVSEDKFKEISKPDKTPKPTPKPTSVVDKDKDENNESDENEIDIADTDVNPEAAPVPDNEPGKIETDLTQMVSDTGNNSSYNSGGSDYSSGSDFERIELEDDNSYSSDNSSPPPSSDGGDGSTYKIQAGLYVSEDNAKQMAEDLNSGGYDATVVQVENEQGKTYYRVQAGAFNDKNNADNLVTDLKDNDYDVFVVSE